MKKGVTIIIAIAIINMAGAMAKAADNPVNLSIDGTYASAFIWRGIPFNAESVIQPSITMSQGDFWVNLWGNIDMTDWGAREGGYKDKYGSLTEIDYSAGWSHAFGPAVLGGGFYNYTFPNTPFASTTEAFASVGFDIPTTPTFTYYLDVDGARTAPSAYISADFSQSLPLVEEGDVTLSLDFFAHAAYATDEWLKDYYGGPVEGDKWHDWSAGMSIPIGLPAGFSITPSASFNSLIDLDIREEMDRAWGRSPDNWLFSVNLGWSGDIF